MISELGNNLIPVLAITGTFTFLIIWVIAATVDSIYKTNCNARLKERLIDRGATAEEIDQVIKAGATKEELDAMGNPLGQTGISSAHPGKAF